MVVLENGVEGVIIYNHEKIIRDLKISSGIGAGGVGQWRGGIGRTTVITKSANCNRGLEV